MTTYQVNAKCNKTQGIDVTFKGIATLEQAFECANTLEGAFSDVNIVCEQTGEVMYNRYVATDCYNPHIEMGKAIFTAEFNLHV